MISKIKESYNFSKISQDDLKFIQSEILEEIGINLPFMLRPRQIEALFWFIKKGTDISVFLPTGYGKTIVAVLCSLYIYKTTGKSTIYIGILKALTKELNETIEDYFLQLPIQDFEQDDVNEIISNGKTEEEAVQIVRSSIILDGDHRGNTIGDEVSFVLASLTPEKLDSILNNPKKREIFMEKVGFVIGDEIHCLGDLGRGDRYEHLLITIKHAYPEVRFAYLSATVKNIIEFSEWLETTNISAEASERPVPLKVDFHKYVKQWYDFQKRKANYYANLDLKKKLLKSIVDNNEGNNIVFTTSRPRTEQIAQYLTGSRKNLSLFEMVEEYGIAYHNAGLTKKQKHYVEDAFRSGIVKTVVSTPTLAVGVNLPANSCIIFDVTQWTQCHGENVIDANRIQQTMGRAGRPTHICQICEGEIKNNICQACGWENKGKAFFICATDSSSDNESSITKYRVENPLVVESKLKARLHEKILQWMASGLVDSMIDIYELCSKSFDNIDIADCNMAMNWLNVFGFVKKTETEFEITTLGKKTIQCYIQPETVIDWKKNMQGFKNYNDFRELFVRFASTLEYYSVVGVRSEDLDLLNYATEEFGYYFPTTYKNDYKPCVSCEKKHECSMVLDNNNKDSDCKDYETDIPETIPEQVLKAGALTFYDDLVVPHLPMRKKQIWKDGRKRWVTTDEVKHLAFAPGDKRALQDTADRMFGAASYIFSENKLLQKNLKILSQMGKSGTLNPDLISLMGMKEIGITRAKLLFENGIKSRAQFMSTDSAKIGEMLKLSTRVITRIKRDNKEGEDN
jgi:helicase